MRSLRLPFAALVVTLLPAAWPLTRAVAQTTLQTNPVADTFVAANGPGYPVATFGDATMANYGSAGAMQLAPAGANRGERQSFLRFDLAATVNSFNATYGVGGWVLSAVSLRLASNFSVQNTQPNNAVFNPINGGLFDVRWMVDDSWAEGNGTPMSASTTGGLTFNSFPNFLAAGDFSLGTQTFTPAATQNSTATYSLGLDPGFVSDLSAGNPVSLHLLAADTGVSYLFNSRTNNSPVLFLTAVPEPGTLFLVGAAGLGGMGIAVHRRRRHRV